MPRFNVIAEMCCNHMGSLSYAMQMIDKLASVPEKERVDVVKFQKRNPRLCLSEKDYNAPHPNPKTSFGETYGAHREFLEFSIEQHRLLKNYAEEKGFVYSCSVFDKDSMSQVLSLEPDMIKVGSANNIDYELLSVLDREFKGGKGIHVSLGMTTKEEEKRIIQCFKNSLDKVVLYACTSSYPLAPENVCLYEISRIKELYGDEVLGIGFSGHHMGIYQDIAALALGATYIERHFTLDRNNKGTDQSISLEYPEFAELVKALKEVQLGLEYKQQDILDCELDVRRRLKYKGALICR